MGLSEVGSCVGLIIGDTVGTRVGKRVGGGDGSGVIGRELSNASNSEGGGESVSNEGAKFPVGEVVVSARSGASGVGDGLAVVIEGIGVGGPDTGAGVGESVSGAVGAVVGSDVLWDCGGSGSIFDAGSDAAVLSSASASASAHACDATPAYRSQWGQCPSSRHSS